MVVCETNALVSLVTLFFLEFGKRQAGILAIIQQRGTGNGFSHIVFYSVLISFLYSRYKNDIRTEW